MSIDGQRFVIDGSVRRVGGGRVLIGGSPLRLLRLTDAGARLIDRIAGGETIASATGGASGTAASDALIDRLLDAGVIHPVPGPVEPGRTDLAVTVVIPAFSPSPGALQQLVAGCTGAQAVIVVDDASPVPIAPVAGATLIRHETNSGPGAARTTGAGLAITPLVAFVDTDVTVGDGWMAPLIAHFADDRVALVAPRVASAPGDGTIARYEAGRSPLDLGDQPARVRAGTRVSYVPTAAVVVRVDAWRAVGGFDESMRVGEDVDLVWRLDEAGHGIRYEPVVTVRHRPRPDFGAWARQRFGYGSSAAPLARRHPGALAPVRVSGWSAASWAAATLGWPVVGGAIAAVTTGLLARKLRDVPDGRREALRLAGLGHLFAGRSLASAVTRAWWPVAVIGALCSRRVRRMVLLAALAPPSIDWARTRPGLDPLTYVGLRIADDLAYGAGLVSGMIAERSLDAARPDFSSWPARPNERRRRSPVPTAG